MALHRPSLHRQRSAQAAFLLALALALLGLGWQSEQPVSGFVSPPSLRSVAAQPRLASRVQLAAEGGEVVDADVVGEEDEDEVEEFEEEEAGEELEEVPAGAYPPEAYLEYPGRKAPPESWFNRQKIDRHKVNSLFFDMFKKDKNFFPHLLQPGDTVRIYYMDATLDMNDKIDKNLLKVSGMRETYFDGVILNFKGEYHGRTMTVRAMVGKNVDVMGMELNFPMHSPLVRKIEVLRRGYIGRNKNAYFLRGMVGKRNVIPLDKERAQMDEMYLTLREEGRADEIPESAYPQQEWDRYPLPDWKQDMDEWDEEKYNPEHVDTRSDYERVVIGRAKQRAPGPWPRPLGMKKGR